MVIKILTNYLSEFDVRITISSWLYCFQVLILFLKGRNINLLRPNINFFLNVSGYIEGIPGVIYVLTSTNSVEMKSVELIGLDQFFSPTSSDGEPRQTALTRSKTRLIFPPEFSGRRLVFFLPKRKIKVCTMQEDIGRTFALRFDAFPSLRAITELKVHLDTGEPEFFLRGNLCTLSRTVFLEDLASP